MTLIYASCLIFAGALMAEDKILQVMPSVVLALHLLCEQRSPESKWKPYLGMILFNNKNMGLDT